MTKLTLRSRFDASFFDTSLNRDDFSYLSVDVETERIFAKGGFWVQWHDVKEFGEALGGFQLVRINPSSLSGALTCRRAMTSSSVLRLHRRTGWGTCFSDLKLPTMMSQKTGREVDS
jgi:hypothetical protein